MTRMSCTILPMWVPKAMNTMHWAASEQQELAIKGNTKIKSNWWNYRRCDSCRLHERIGRAGGIPVPFVSGNCSN